MRGKLLILVAQIPVNRGGAQVKVIGQCVSSGGFDLGRCDLDGSDAASV